MLRLARAYAALIRAGLLGELEYRAQALLWLLLAIVPLIMMNVWLALVDQAGPAGGWRRADFIAYYVAVAMVYQFTTSYASWEWGREVRSGDLSTRLLKPIAPFHYYLSLDIGGKLFSAAVIVPMVALAAWLLPDLSYPLTPGRLAAFVAAVLAGYLLNTLMATAFGLIALWTTQSANLAMLWYGVGQILSGWLAPLALFPGWFSSLAIALPFRSTLGFPVEILTGRLDGAGIAAGFAITAAWTLVFAAIYRALWARGLRRYEAVGG
jgi:ABC-2 type transport system permease protein